MKARIFLKGFNIVVIEIFKFQKMCINMHDGSNIISHHLNNLI